jgi:hypothetical protein
VLLGFVLLTRASRPPSRESPELFNNAVDDFLNRIYDEVNSGRRG